MLERFTRERQRASRGDAFNLEDNDELTHYGQSLSKLDDFDNVGLGLDDDEDEGMLSHPFILNEYSSQNFTMQVCSIGMLLVNLTLVGSAMKMRRVMMKTDR